MQLVGKKPSVMAEASIIARDNGADFVDINLGCPIDDVTRRGMGASLLKRASRVGDMVAAMKKAVDIPVTIKLRLGWSSEKPTFLKVARAARDAGVDAIILHARSRAQRYRRPADWDRITELVEAVPDVPVIGNGDILTWRDANRMIRETGCAGAMIGRWALAKPWIFREHKEKRDLENTAEDRLAVLRRYVELCRNYFRDDDKGRKRIRFFLTFHQDFFRRYRRGAKTNAVNSDDPRYWGEPPAGELEEWLCRGDRPAVEALCDWLVEGRECEPPPPPEGERNRPVKAPALG
jgi:tRNA-dihydrouridine synthase 3